MDQRNIWVKKKNNVRYVNESFFEKWSPKMAYILGFFAADGCLTINRKRGNKYIEFVSTDKDIVEKIKTCLKSKHKIGIKAGKSNWKKAYRLQVGSKKLFSDLVKRGFSPTKSKNLDFPKIPPKYLSDFVRGYFDGDGHSNFCIFNRIDRGTFGKTLLSGFTSGSKLFLQGLQAILKTNAKLSSGTLHFHSGYRLIYASKDSKKLFNFIYRETTRSFCIDRKYLKFKKEIEKFGAVV